MEGETENDLVLFLKFRTSHSHPKNIRLDDFSVKARIQGWDLKNHGWKQLKVKTKFGDSGDISFWQPFFFVIVEGRKLVAYIRSFTFQ